MLASASTSRRRLCGLAMPEGFQLLDEKLKPDIDEKSIRHEDPRKMVVAIAHAKAVKALQMLTDAGMEEESPGFVICCDQVIVFDGEVREKPESAEQAKEHLQSYGLAEKPAECVCGVVVVNVKTGKTVEGVNEAQQFFKEIPDDVANALIQKGEVMYCSGSFVVRCLCGPLVCFVLTRLDWV